MEEPHETMKMIGESDKSQYKPSSFEFLKGIPKFVKVLIVVFFSIIVVTIIIALITGESSACDPLPCQNNGKCQTTLSMIIKERF